MVVGIREARGRLVSYLPGPLTISRSLQQPPQLLNR